MKLPRLGFLACLTLSAVLISGILSPLARAGAPAELLNFGDYRRDPDGTTLRPYEYAYGDWNKAVSAFRNQATLIKAPSGNGGIGDNHAGLDLGGMTAVDLILVIGDGNLAKKLNFLLQDKDGTGNVWNLDLTEKPHGRDVRFHLVLNKPDYVEKPGKTPGLNPGKIVVWQLRGDQSALNVEVLAVKLVQAP